MSDSGSPHPAASRPSATDSVSPAPELDHASLHHAIMHGFVERLRPPTVGELCDVFRRDETEVRGALRALADYHGVVLHPHSDEVCVAHPFSAAPTTFVVSVPDGRRWWGNCAWCSLGVVQLAGGTGVVRTTSGALGDDPISIRFESGRLMADDGTCVVHFPVPMLRAWDNVVYTCSVMLMFRDEQQVDQWCATRGIAKGDVRSVAQVWELAREWYGRHLERSWRKWTTSEAADIFRRHGFDHRVWALPVAPGDGDLTSTGGAERF
eukprot:TRINITY_DN14352_c0_g1_i1.p1 TRINITY_DN14352_c0_g1~~TRINITY_DN14352_c0_g1_i1.p1  ORF type:complete len:266 (-),score=60.77 TRINITY_DN14352_c0_g1_i1:936-1733(-)